MSDCATVRTQRGTTWRLDGGDERRRRSGSRSARRRRRARRSASREGAGRRRSARSAKAERSGEDRKAAGRKAATEDEAAGRARQDGPPHAPAGGGGAAAGAGSGPAAGPRAHPRGHARAAAGGRLEPRRARAPRRGIRPPDATAVAVLPRSGAATRGPALAAAWLHVDVARPIAEALVERFAIGDRAHDIDRGMHRPQDARDRRLQAAQLPGRRPSDPERDVLASFCLGSWDPATDAHAERNGIAGS